jgi:hypothetical protein
LESNHLSYASIKRGGGIVDKTYRIYDKKFGESDLNPAATTAGNSDLVSR